MYTDKKNVFLTLMLTLATTDTLGKNLSWISCQHYPLTLQWTAVSPNRGRRFKPNWPPQHGKRLFIWSDPTFCVAVSWLMYSKAVSEMTLRCVTRRHFPPLPTLSPRQIPGWDPDTPPTSQKQTSGCSASDKLHKTTNALGGSVV